MGDTDPGYQFGSGIGDDELARLEAQGTATAMATRTIFAEAGIQPGMRVLDMDWWLPETPLATQVKSWLVEAFARAGIATLGPRLWTIVQEAGLRPLGMIGIQQHFGPGDPIGIAAVVENLRVAVPLIVGTGVATAEEIGMETFEERLRDEQQRTQAVGATPMLLGAWATTGPE
jgi:hypothetical protein